MRVAVVLALVAVAAANPRTRRQADGCFWWIEGDCDENSSSTTTTTTTTTPAPQVDADSGVRSGVGASPPAAPNPAPNVVTYCNNGLGECVPYYLCKEGNIITDGAGLLDIRIGGASENATSVRSSSDCPQYLDVCCTTPETVQPTPAPYIAKCGQRKTEGFDVRITGFTDNQAQFAEFPWMAAVLRSERVGSKEVNLYVCGGSLIHPQILLTAAHCVYGKPANTLKVRLGEWDTQRTYEQYPHQDRGVLSITFHERYNAGSLFNNVALLFLDAPADLGPNVDTVCLPDYLQSFVGYTCTATGWGRDEFGKGGEFQNVLKEVPLPVVDNINCQNSLRTTRLGSHFILDPSFMCAGGVAGLDTCKGDGGSPLVCQGSDGAYVQAGIVSWGIGCGEDGVPGVYADVAYNVEWIKTNADNGLATLYGSNAPYPWIG